MPILATYLGCCLLCAVSAASPPHIILFLADDLGWNDVSFHGSVQIPTPNIDALAYNGVILNNYYSQPTGTPSRTALMTGRYPFHLGMQGPPILAAEPRGLPLQEKILPQYLKDLNYVTRAVGKWHLGFYKTEFTPTHRGFDSHLGFWGGLISYYDHIYSEEDMSGHDFRRNMETAWELDGQYATDVFTNVSVNIIKSHNKSTPLFLYVAHAAVHAGNIGKPLEAPQEVVNKFSYISDPNRRTYAGMVSKLDESVGQIVQTLMETGMLNNSIIIFISDNGAPSVGDYQNWGSNYPLRGNKASLWEGGVRCVSLVWSPLINESRRVSNELMHVTDWLPTLITAAGGNASELASNLDGIDQWSSISNNQTSTRKQGVVLNIDEVLKNAAIRDGDWKLVFGSFGTNGSMDGYFGKIYNEGRNPLYNISSVTNSTAWKSFAPHSSTATVTEINEIRELATIKCMFDSQYPETDCNPSATKQPCLFNVVEDPCEMHNLANTKETVTRRLYNKLTTQKQSLVPEKRKPLDYEGANPAKFNQTWSPWQD